MNQKNRDIDSLLQENVERQLAHIDWDRFGDDVLKRLAAVGLEGRSRVKHIVPLAVAAGLVLAAGVLVTCLILQRDPSVAPGRATVSMQETPQGAASATVVFSDDGATSTTRCEVTLIDSNGSPADESAESRWCIVVKSVASPARSSRHRDRENTLCLF